MGQEHGQGKACLGNLSARPSVISVRTMKTLTLLPLLAAVAALWLACEGAEAPPLTSGIEGQVLLGPACPVVQEGTPCPDSPYQATIVVWNAERTKKLRTFTTDADGRFHVGLAPGRYYLDPQPPDSGGPPTPEPQTVDVPAGRFLQLTVRYDSGIR